MRRFAAMLRDTSGATAAEFALTIPILVVFLLGIMDVGFYAWAINRSEKATQMGARYAVVTDLVPANLTSYSFASSGEVPQGTTVPQNLFPTVTCTSTTCTQWGHDPTAFANILARMRMFDNSIEADNVRIEYSWSGLGYAGDPNGPDVAPIVTVRLVNMQHTPIFTLLVGTVDLPEFAYSLTAEDSDGDRSN